MLRRSLSLFLLITVLLVFTADLVLAEDDGGDPLGATPEEVDPDGLEGIHVGGVAPSGELPVGDSPRGSFLVQFLIRIHRLLAI